MIDIKTKWRGYTMWGWVFHIKELFEIKLERAINSSGVPQNDECEHDWEIVSEGNYWRARYAYDDVWTYFDSNPYGPKNRFNYIAPFYIAQRAKNRVCVKCGECDNQEDRFKNLFIEQKRKANNEKIAERRRKAWAKQLWEDGCKKQTGGEE